MRKSIFILALASFPAFANEALFSDSDLMALLARRGSAITWTVTEEIPASLPPNERLGSDQLSVDFVLREQTPLSIDSSAALRTVRVPLETVLFVDQLSVVLAWFYAHHCPRQYIDTYLWALLGEHQSLKAPLAAFNIDEAEAVSDFSMNQQLTQIYNGILHFLLAHEVGHVMLGHSEDLTGRASQAREVAADQFALDRFAAIGLPPIDIVEYFLAARWLDPVGDAAAQGTHPISPRRLQAIADRLFADPDAFTRAYPDPIRGRAMNVQAALDIAMIANSMFDDGTITVTPQEALLAGFPLSRLATACPGTSSVIPRAAIEEGR